MRTNHLSPMISFIIAFALFGGGISCAKKNESESELQSKISLSVTGPEYVLPNTLTNTINDTDDSLSKYLTCLEDGSVTGPRVRIRKITVNWTGTGKLLPLVLQVKAEDKIQLGGGYTFTLTSASSATISSFFGRATDYIPEGAGAVSNEDTGSPGTSANSRCYMDLPGIPKPKTIPTGSSQLKITAKLVMSALVETIDETGAPVYTPVTKEVPFSFVYIDGSIPIN